jgi:hypothetical protein
MASKTESAIQSQAKHKPMHKALTSLKNTSLKTLPPALFLCLLTVISFSIIAPSVVAITSDKCGEGSVSVRLWQFEYQFSKKSDCNSPTDMSH